MQFQLKTQVFGVNKITVDGNTYCSVFTGQPSTDETSVKGLEVTKVSADPIVFDQLPETFTPGDQLEFIAMLRRAAGGKSQPYLVGIVPSAAKATTGANATQAKSASTSTANK